MLQNYFKIAFRNIFKQKGYSLINISGLSIALAVTLLMLLWIQDEWNTDKFHVKGDRIFRIQRVLPQEGHAMTVNNNLPYPFLKTIDEEVPEVEAVLPLSYELEYTLERGKRAFRETGIYGNAAIFESFTFPILKGDINQFSAKLNTIALSENLAKKLFGDQWESKAIGEVIELEDKGEHIVEVVFKNLPPTSSVKFEFIYHIESHLKHNKWMLEWGNNGMGGVFLLAEGADAQTAMNKIDGIYKASEAFEEGEFIRFQNFAEYYLYGKFDEKAAVSGGRIEYVRIIGIAALLLLLISCINFINLATARASKRAKEVGVRKTIGAGKNALITQFMIESFVITIMAIAVAVILAEMFLPTVQTMTGKLLTLEYNRAVFWLGISGILISTTFLAGAYPSFILSSFKPVNVLKGKYIERLGNLNLRKSLVVIQFVLALLLIVGALVIQQQIHFIKNKNLGLERENLIYIPKDQKVNEKFEVLQTELMAQEGIAAVTATSHSPLEVYSSTSGVSWPGKRADQSHQQVFMLWAEDNFLEAFNISMIDGRFYNKGTTWDTTHLVINQTAANVMQLDNPVGSIIQWWGKPRQIIGVVQDFHIQSLYNKVEPMAILLDNENTWSMFVKTKPALTEVAIKNLEATYNKVLPDAHLYYEFVDEQYQKNYKSEMLIGYLVNYFAFISIFISCLGLLGLVAFLAEQKTKEIGIRKVLGASILNVIGLLSKEFLTLVVIGLLIGLPVSWYLLTGWLDKFAYKIELTWWMFALPVITAILIAGISVGTQAVRAALTNPVESLRNE